MYYFPPYKSYLQLLTRNFMEIDGIVCLLDTKTIEWIYLYPFWVYLDTLQSFNKTIT